MQEEDCLHLGGQSYVMRIRMEVHHSLARCGGEGGASADAPRTQDSHHDGDSSLGRILVNRAQVRHGSNGKDTLVTP